jgi:3-hydroxybutyryl-CoA dehydrogenase
MQIKTVGVLGCGLMGAGIAQVCAASGYKTIVREVEDAFLKKGLGRIDKFLAGGVEKGKLTAEEKDTTLGNLSGTTRLDDLKDCDLIIEAIIENVEEKAKAYAILDGVVGEHAIFCSNTSSLCITELAAKTTRPDRFAGLHFFNPVPVMKLVEVVRAIGTSDETIARVTAFARSLGKEPIAARDNSGFVVNRLLVPFLLDAIRAHEQGVGSLEDIDTGMKLGCAHPMGPFELLDYVGLDTVYAIAEIMFLEYREARFAPPPLLKRMVLAGRFGRKTGRGFFEYDEKGNRRARE